MTPMILPLHGWPMNNHLPIFQKSRSIKNYSFPETPNPAGPVRIHSGRLKQDNFMP